MSSIFESELKTIEIEGEVVTLESLGGCDQEDEEDQRYSIGIYRLITTVKDFLRVFSLFYLNKICSPVYFATFQGDSGNEQVDKKMVDLFFSLTNLGLITIDSQAPITEDKFMQKGYMVGFLPKRVSSKIIAGVNSYNGMIAFADEIKPYSRNESVDPISVSYSSYGRFKIKDVSPKLGTNYSKGAGVTSVSGPPDKEEADGILSYCRSVVKKKFFSEYNAFFIVDADFRSTTTRMMEITYKVMLDLKVSKDPDYLAFESSISK